MYALTTRILLFELTVQFFRRIVLSMHKTPTQKKGDWHRAEIVCALHMKGISLRRLSKHHGYASPGTLIHALNRKWPKGERLIAEAIGIPPAEIWPSRYPAEPPENSTPR